MRSSTQGRSTRFLLAAAAMLGAWALALSATPAWAQFGLSQQVGGVWIDADGVLRNREVDETNRVRAAREALLQPVPADAQRAGLRMVSLRRLEEAIAQHRKTGEPLSDEMKYLAGLQRIQYVFVYPELGDIVLAGPGEGWKLNDAGDLVGVTTGRPVMWLDDLLVALRTRRRHQADRHQLLDRSDRRGNRPRAAAREPAEAGPRRTERHDERHRRHARPADDLDQGDSGR